MCMQMCVCVCVMCTCACVRTYMHVVSNSVCFVVQRNSVKDMQITRCVCVCVCVCVCTCVYTCECAEWAFLSVCKLCILYVCEYM